MTQQEAMQTLSPSSKNQYEASEKGHNGYEDDENDFDLRDNNVGGLDTYYVQANMDH
jgi:hypothetical protein